jgi:hypothetical protein
MKDLIFAFMLGSGEAEKDALRLASSIRAFGGELCFNPIWLVSHRKEDELTEVTQQRIFSLGARLINFDPQSIKTKVAFSSYVTAAAVAEGMAQGEASFLAWLATDTLILQPPVSLLLPAGKSLGGCPVHLKLLGSGFDDPIDEYWGLVYRHCQVDVAHIFPMRTVVDEQLVRAYFNAGLLVVRPERGLLRAWQSRFEKLADLPEFHAFYTQNELYEIFIHQAILAGSILALLKPEEFQPLPFEMNYPLHLHTRVAAFHRPTRLEQLISCRYEEYAEFFDNPNLDVVIHIDQPLKDWLQAQG